jgi:hypothetical protein
MNKKEMKWYVTPASETIETELEGFLCASDEGANLPPYEEERD